MTFEEVLIQAQPYVEAIIGLVLSYLAWILRGYFKDTKIFNVFKKDTKQKEIELLDKQVELLERIDQEDKLRAEYIINEPMYSDEYKAKLKELYKL